MQLSIIIVNYNVKYLLEQCLRSVQEATADIEAEVIVVDNASEDGSVGYLQPRFPEVHFIANTNNVGFAAANNQALRTCRGQYVLLLNPDTIVSQDTLHSACRFMQQHPDAGAIGVKMIDGHGAFLPESKRSFPTPWIAFCKLFGLARLFPYSRRFAAYSLPYLAADGIHKVDVLSGAFMLLRSEALQCIGLLDEAFFMYGEDIDLSYRMITAGYRNYYLPLTILHYKGESTRYADPRYLDAFYDAMLIFYRKHYPRASRLTIGLISLAVGLRKSFSGLFGWKRSRRRRTEREDLLLLCNEPHAVDVRDRVLRHFPNAQAIAWRNASQISDIPVGTYTDVILCHPDIPFGRMINMMDRCLNKSITYHIIYPSTDRWISPTR